MTVYGLGKSLARYARLGMLLDEDLGSNVIEMTPQR